jgi:hypothetical protein
MYITVCSRKDEIPNGRTRVFAPASEALCKIAVAISEGSYSQAGSIHEA